MKSQAFKFYVYFIIISFIILFIQGAYVTIKNSSEYEHKAESPSEIILTVAPIQESTEDYQINQIGVVAWTLVGIAFSGGVVAAAILNPLQLNFSRSTKHRKAHTSRRSTSRHARGRTPVYASSYKTSHRPASTRTASLGSTVTKTQKAYFVPKYLKHEVPFYTIRTTQNSASGYQSKVVKRYWK